jgi:hypothetical protein
VKRVCGCGSETGFGEGGLFGENAAAESERDLELGVDVGGEVGAKGEEVGCGSGSGSNRSHLGEIVGSGMDVCV